MIKKPVAKKPAIPKPKKPKPVEKKAKDAMKPVQQPVTETAAPPPPTISGDQLSGPAPVSVGLPEAEPAPDTRPHWLSRTT